MIQTPEGAKALVEALSTQVSRGQKARAMKDIADALIAHALGESRAKRVREWKLPGYASLEVLEDTIQEGRRLAIAWKATGKVVDNFRGLSSLSDAPEGNLYSESLAFVPMSRFDAILKGIGPAECVRLACNRYLEAFSPEALYMRVLQKGKELGYVSIRRVKDKKTGSLLWFMETMQFPWSDASVDGVEIKLRAVLAEFQRQALREGASLALPAHDKFNMYNFKDAEKAMENILKRSDVAHQEASVSELDFAAKSRFARHLKSPAAAIDREMTANNGYPVNGGRNLTNYFTYHGNDVRILGPLTEQPDWFWKLGYDVRYLKKKPSEVAVDESRVLLPGERAVYRAVSGARLDIVPDEQVDAWKKDAATAERVGAHLDWLRYRALPPEVRDRKPLDQALWVKEHAKELSDSVEVLHDLWVGAKTWEDAVFAFRLLEDSHDITSKHILELAKRFGPLASGPEATRFYLTYLRHLTGREEDVELTRFALKQVTSAADLLTVFRAARGEFNGKGQFTGIPYELDKLIIEAVERFFPTLTSAGKRVAFFQNILYRVNNDTDKRLREFMLARAGSLEEMAAMLSKARPLTDEWEHSSIIRRAAETLIAAASPRSLATTEMDVRRLQPWFRYTDGEALEDALKKKGVTEAVAQFRARQGTLGDNLMAPVRWLSDCARSLGWIGGER